MPERILIAGPAWVGDMVMTQSLCITLKQQRPQAMLDVLAPKWSLPIIARMPQVRRGVELPTGHGELGWGKRRRLGHALREQAYDQAVVLPRSAKAALVPWFAKVPRRTGFRGELRYGLINDVRTLDKRKLPQTVQRFVALGLTESAPQPPQVPYPELQVDAARQSQLCGALGLSQGLSRDAGIVGIMPGAEYGPAKQWPAAHFGVLARRLGEQGIRVWIFGSAKERGLGAAIAAYAPETTSNLCGRTELVDTVDLLALCDAAVSNDSGLMHVAAATGIPLVALYGSSTPVFTPPLSDAANLIHHDLACSPCFERNCPLAHTHCLTGISVSEVLSRLPPALARPRAAVVK